MKKVVVIGGGSGLATLLRGLRDYPLDITAIVTMTDDGASSGRLRRDFGILPPGDIRKCIAALSQDEAMLTELFQYRFRSGLGLKGHSLGNLIISALRDITGNFELAIEEVSKILNIKGKVIPATLDDVNLAARYEDGYKIIGESSITKYGYKHKIEKVYLTKKPKSNPRAIEAIAGADVILVGPGSLYTSIIPNFLQDKLLHAYNNSKGVKMYVCNVSTERGETIGFSVSDHLAELAKYDIAADVVIANSHVFPVGAGDGFVTPVQLDSQKIKSTLLVSADVVDLSNPLYHDSTKLASVVDKFITERAEFTKPDFSDKII